MRLEDDWVPMDEQLAPGELEEVIRTKEAHSRAVVLESVSISSSVLLEQFLYVVSKSRIVLFYRVNISYLVCITDRGYS